MIREPRQALFFLLKLAVLLSFLTSLTMILTSPDSLVGSHYRFADDKFNNGFTENQYDRIIDHVVEIYGPIIQAEGGELRILSDWTDGAVNMWAERLGNEYWLEIPGGMSRYYLINEAAFMISICHELGHLLGGEPKNGVISFEGQSDYFANLDCSSLLFIDWRFLKGLDEDSEVSLYCQQSANEYCDEVIKGSKSLTSYYAELEGASFPKISKKDASKVGQTLVSHPKSQCRLDTLVASFEKQKRPRCWFKD